MPNMSSIELIGHLGRDPEVKTLQSGDMVAKFSIATTKKRQSGDITSWWNVTAWGKTAEVVGRYLRKGAPVYVRGEAIIREWQTEDGKKGKNVEVDVRQLVLLGGRQDADHGDGTAADQGSQGGSPDTWREDVPF